MGINARVLDHARHPRNWGELEDANGVMIIVQDCGDIVMFFIKVENMVMEKVHYLVQGCHNLIACCSMLSVLAQRKTVWDAMEITPEQVLIALDNGIPPEERHVASYACDALYGAIQNYLKNARKKANPELHRSMMGDGWRSLYLQAQQGQHYLENLYEKRKKAGQ